MPSCNASPRKVAARSLLAVGNSDAGGGSTDNSLNINITISELQGLIARTRRLLPGNCGPRAEVRAVHAGLVRKVLLADAERFAASADELAERVVLCGASVDHEGGNLPDLAHRRHGIYPVLEDIGLPGVWLLRSRQHPGPARRVSSASRPGSCRCSGLGKHTALAQRALDHRASLTRALVCLLADAGGIDGTAAPRRNSRRAGSCRSGPWWSASRASG
jgi:hypothetical protein